MDSQNKSQHFKENDIGNGSSFILIPDAKLPPMTNFTSQPNLEPVQNQNDLQSELELPRANSLLDRQKQIQNYNDSPIKKSSIDQSNIKIPQVSNLGLKSQEIQEHLAEGKGLTSLQLYKQFKEKNLQKEGKFETTDFLKAFSFYIFNLFSLTQEGKLKLIKLKNKVYKIQSLEGSILQSRWSTIKSHAGENLSNDQIKRLFLEYIIKLFDDEKSIQIISKYYVLSDVLSMIVRQYTRLNIGTIQGEKFEKSMKDNNIKDIYCTYSSAFKLKYQYNNNRHIFQLDERKLIIEEIYNLFRSYLV